jgi:hypothetical protein
MNFNTDKIRWMGYDLLGYLLIIIIAIVVFKFELTLLSIFMGWAIYQGIKLWLCADAKRYPEWNLVYYIRSKNRDV